MSLRSASRKASHGAERSVTWLRSSGYVLGLPTEDLAALREAGETGSGRTSLDLAELFALPDADECERRTLVLTGEPGLDLVVRADVKVESVPVARILPLPAYLSGLSETLSLSAVIARESGYGLLIDVGRLRASVARGGAA